MSAQAINLLLGTGRMYAKRYATGTGASDSDGKWKLIGSIKGMLEFTYTPTFAEQRPSDTKTYIRRDLIDEKASMKATLVDFRIDQLRWMLGMSASTSGLSKTISIRLAQELTAPASTTTTKSLSRTAKSTTSVAFSSLDRSTDYVKATDFTMATTKKFKAISAAFKGKAVRAYYTRLFTPSASSGMRINMGDQLVLQQISLMYVHQQANGKHVSIQFPIATIDGPLKLDFKEKEYTMPEMVFSALGDPTLAKGRKLFSIVREP